MTTTMRFIGLQLPMGAAQAAAACGNRVHFRQIVGTGDFSCPTIGARARIWNSKLREKGCFGRQIYARGEELLGAASGKCQVHILPTPAQQLPISSFALRN
jgi:hypothetical protein